MQYVASAQTAAPTPSVAPGPVQTSPEPAPEAPEIRAEKPAAPIQVDEPFKGAAFQPGYFEMLQAAEKAQAEKAATNISEPPQSAPEAPAQDSAAITDETVERFTPLLHKKGFIPQP